MPPKLHGSLPRSLSRLATASEGFRVFYCPSCTTWRRSLLTQASPLRRLQNDTTATTTSNIRHRRRYVTSPSVVNATKNVPARFKELHSALEGVGEAAATHVNMSRLHLAQRGLESERPVIRVAGMFLSLYRANSTFFFWDEMANWNHFCSSKLRR